MVGYAGKKRTAGGGRYLQKGFFLAPEKFSFQSDDDPPCASPAPVGVLRVIRMSKVIRPETGEERSSSTRRIRRTRSVLRPWGRIAMPRHYLNGKFLNDCVQVIRHYRNEGDAVISIGDDGIRRRPVRPSSSCHSGGGMLVCPQERLHYSKDFYRTVFLLTGLSMIHRQTAGRWFKILFSQ